MDSIKVNVEGLQTLAVYCASVACRLTADVPAQLPGPPYQATSGATAATYAGLTGASRVLATRMQATGNKVDAAAASYVNQEDSTAQKIAALATTVQA